MAARIALALVLVLAMSYEPAMALDPDNRCEADKHKVVARYLPCRHKAIAKVVKFGDSGAPDFSRCESKFSKKWQAVEAKAGPACPTVSDEATITDHKLTHVLVWSPGLIEFSTYHGHHLPGSLLPSEQIFEWSNNGPNVPTPALENVRMNLWLVNGASPMNLQPAEVVISNFYFEP